MKTICICIYIYIYIYIYIGTHPWKETKNPNHLKPGSLIRLGPVYHVPVETEVE